MRSLTKGSRGSFRNGMRHIRPTTRRRVEWRDGEQATILSLGDLRQLVSPICSSTPAPSVSALSLSTRGGQGRIRIFIITSYTNLAIEATILCLLWYLIPSPARRHEQNDSQRKRRLSTPPSPLRLARAAARRGDSPGCTPMMPRITVSGAPSPSPSNTTSPASGLQPAAALQPSRTSLGDHKKTVSFSVNIHPVPGETGSLSMEELHSAVSDLFGIVVKKAKRPATPFVWPSGEDHGESDQAESTLPSRSGTPQPGATMIDITM